MSLLSGSQFQNFPTVDLTIYTKILSQYGLWENVKKFLMDDKS